MSTILHEPHYTSAHTRRDGVHLVEVLGEHGRCQTIYGLVGSLDQFIHVFELHNLHHRPENLSKKQEGSTLSFVAELRIDT